MSGVKTGKNTGLLKAPWKPGQSGNPSGRPKGTFEFRRKCREMAEGVLEDLAKRLKAGALEVPELLDVLQVLADRGGYLAADKQAQVEIAQGRMVLAAMALQQLTADQRQKLIEMWQGMFPAEKLPELDVSTDSNE